MINNFTWHFNTKIIFGSGTIEQTGTECADLGSHVLVVCDGGDFLKSSGLIEQVTKSIESAGLKCDVLGGVQPNPVIDKVREGVELYRQVKADVVLALGGGSAIDTAKAIAAAVNYKGDAWDLFTGKAQVENAPPVGVVSTVAATGSEGSIGAVITNPETNEKYDVLDMSLRPAFAILNPEITLSLPAFQTACGIVDMFSHAMERYFTATKDVELTDRLGEAVMKTVLNNGMVLNEDPKNVEARSQVMWAATLAHNGILEGGRASSWASHAIGTELSAYYGTAHGATLSVIIPAWMEYIYKADIPRFARFANAVMDVEYDAFNPEKTAKAGIAKLKALFKTLNMPTTLAEIGVTDRANYEKMAKSATRFGPAGSIKKLNLEDVIEIYKLAE